MLIIAIIFYAILLFVILAAVRKMFFMNDSIPELYLAKDHFNTPEEELGDGAIEKEQQK
jgi:hypothetical protein